MANPDLLLANCHLGRDFSTQLKDGDIQQIGGGVRLANQEDANDEGPLLPQRFSVENPVDFVDRESVQDNATQPVPRFVAEHLVKLRKELDTLGQVDLNTVHLLPVKQGRLHEKQFAVGHGSLCHG